MYKCGRCDRFSCFGDVRGIHLENPVCDCAILSRAQVAGEENAQKIARAVHYVCAVGGCEYFAYSADAEGEVMVLRSGRLSASEMVAIGL